MMLPADLVEQLCSPYAILALAINLGLFLGPPAVALYLADVTTRRLAAAMGLLAIGFRLVGWYSVPGGLGSDDYVTLTEMRLPNVVFEFHSFFAERTWDNGGNLISNLPWYLGYRVSGSLLAIRFVGALWSGSLAVVVYCFAARLYGRLPALVCAAVATLTVWSLFISRLTFGSEILALHACMIWVAWTLNRQIDSPGRVGLSLITLLGLLTALSQHTYLAARVALAVPVVFIGLWGWTRLNALCLIFAVALSALSPKALTNPTMLFSSGGQFVTLLDPAISDPVYGLTKVGKILTSFVNREYSSGGTNAMAGAHTVGWFISCVVLIGVPFAPRFAVLMFVGLLPALFSSLPAGGSHRMMMMLVPAALVAGAGFSRVPARFQNWACGGAFAGIVVISMLTWLSDDYWALADFELRNGITVHRVFHRERDANPNTALLEGGRHQTLVAMETGNTKAEIATVDCSRPFTLVIEDNAALGERRVASLGGEVVAGTSDQLVILRLNPAQAHHPILSDLSFCRESSDVAPEVIPIDRSVILAFQRHIALWLEADAIEGVKDGNLVERWSDSSGAMRSALQPERAMRPTYRAKGRNGHPVLEFDAKRTNTMTVLALPLPAYTTSFFVLRALTPGSSLPFFEHGTDFNSKPGFLLSGTAPMFGVNRDGFVDVATGRSDWITGSWGVISATYDGAGHSGRFRVRRNGARQDNGATQGEVRNNSTIVDTFHIGSRAERSFWSDMELGEVILMDRPLSETEVEKVERYLAGKWGIALSR